MTLSYPEVFRLLTQDDEHPDGRTPFPYQQRLAEGPWPTVLDVPTGLGKTAAVVLSWLFKRLSGDAAAGTRLVYCLPMRVLVEQTEEAARGWCERAKPLFDARRLKAPSVHVLMGGAADNEWDAAPDEPAILIGTQDMLLSRALNRGYGLSRYRWPMHFALLSNDATWVFDETQLMGVGVETSAQLHAFRKALGANGTVTSMWTSATIGEGQLATVDHPPPNGGWSRGELGASDLADSVVKQRVEAKKSISRLDGWRIEKATAKESTPAALAKAVRREHDARGGLTLVVVNQVARARELYAALKKGDEEGSLRVALIHSRFRTKDRARHAALLDADGDRIVVATQAIEAGVDVSASTLITELAPWSSLVQRFGRCNRYGEVDGACILWIDVDTADEKAKLALPYEAQDLDEARELLGRLVAQGGDAGPGAVRELPYVPREVIRPVLRRRDLVDLFDTTADLCGDDIDVSRYVRDGNDTDVQFYWRDLDGDGPSLDEAEPRREELCRVQIGRAAEFLKALEAKRRKLNDGGEKDKARAKPLRAWLWNPVAKRWDTTTSARPGQVVLLHTATGGYHPELGWTGEPVPKAPVPIVSVEGATVRVVADDANESDVDTSRWGRWVRLSDHLGHVRDESRTLAEALGVQAHLRDALATAGLWHDVGKAHAAFQHQLLGPLEANPEVPRPAGAGPWAKSSHTLRVKQQRRGFRHELASALAWLAATEDELSDEPCDGVCSRDLVAYLIAAHHGKVRLSIRSMPGEPEADGDSERLVARGVWDGEALPPVELPDGRRFEGLELDLSIMRLGEGSWLERMLALRDAAAIGPFRLALLETIVRAADWRASKKEQEGAYDDA